MSSADAPSQTPPVRCTRCDTPLPADQTSCPSCGTRVASSVDEDSIGLGLTRVQGAAETSIPLNIDFVGETLAGRFTVAEELGRGGMGRAWRATDNVLKRDVVVKVPHPALLMDEQFRTRFQREVKRLIELRHPNVVRVLDTGSHRGLPYVVLEYLGGGNLASRLRRAAATGKPLAYDKIIDKLRPVASALDFMHSQEVIHRDVKPENILFDEHGHPFLADFGIAKALGGETQQLTGTGLAPGTPAYMAPEQATGKHLSGAADQYALGIVLYEILAGELPFSAETPMDALIQKHSTTPKPVHELNRRVPAPAAMAIQRALTKDPGARHPSCSTFLDAVQRGLAGQAIPEMPPVSAPQDHRRAREERAPPEPAPRRERAPGPAPQPPKPRRDAKRAPVALQRGHRRSIGDQERIGRPMAQAWIPRMQRAIHRGYAFPVVSPTSILVALGMIAVACLVPFGSLKSGDARLPLYLTDTPFHGGYIIGLAASIAILLLVRAPWLAVWINLAIFVLVIVDVIRMNDAALKQNVGSLAPAMPLMLAGSLFLLISLTRTNMLWGAWQVLRKEAAEHE